MKLKLPECLVELESCGIIKTKRSLNAGLTYSVCLVLCVLGKMRPAILSLEDLNCANHQELRT